MNKSELMTIVSDVLLNHTKLHEERVEELSDLISDAVLANEAGDEEDGLARIPPTDFGDFEPDDFEELLEEEF